MALNHSVSNAVQSILFAMGEAQTSGVGNLKKQEIFALRASKCHGAPCLTVSIMDTFGIYCKHCVGWELWHEFEVHHHEPKVADGIAHPHTTTSGNWRRSIARDHRVAWSHACARRTAFRTSKRRRLLALPLANFHPSLSCLPSFPSPSRRSDARLAAGETCPADATMDYRSYDTCQEPRMSCTHETGPSEKRIMDGTQTPRSHDEGQRTRSNRASVDVSFCRHSHVVDAGGRCTSQRDASDSVRPLRDGERSCFGRTRHAPCSTSSCSLVSARTRSVAARPILL